MPSASPAAAVAISETALIGAALSAGPLTIDGLRAATDLPAYILSKRLQQNGPRAVCPDWRYFAKSGPLWSLTARGAAHFGTAAPASLTVPAPAPAVVCAPRPVRTVLAPSPPPRPARVRPPRVARGKPARPFVATDPTPLSAPSSNPKPVVPFVPTTAVPGSAEKYAVLEYRARHKLPLFHPDDARSDDDGLSVALLRALANGARRNDG